jgi:hypothetical protein
MADQARPEPAQNQKNALAAAQTKRQNADERKTKRLAEVKATQIDLKREAADRRAAKNAK